MSDDHKEHARARLTAAVTWAQRIERERPFDHKQIAAAWGHVRRLRAQLRTLGIITLMALPLFGCVTVNNPTPVSPCRDGRGSQDADGVWTCSTRVEPDWWE